MTRSMTTTCLLLIGTFTFSAAQAASLTSLGYLPGYANSGYGSFVQNDGTVYGHDWNENTSEKFVWSKDAGKRIVNALPDHNERSTSDYRYTLSFDSNSKTFRRLNSDNSRTYLGDLPSGYKDADGSSISDDGNKIVGELLSTTDNYEVFLWTQKSGVANLKTLLQNAGVDTSHWKTLQYANSISDNGMWITGSGINQQGKSEAFLANVANISPVPEASSFALFGLGLAAVVGVRRRQLKVNAAA